MHNVKAKRFSIPRRYVTEKVGKTTLVGFCDASTKGYVAVIYFRKETPSGDVQTMLLGSKTRVAPMGLKHDENQTVPRLELLGCFILSRFMATVSKALREEVAITERYFFTDSTINLHRIKGLKREYKQFVENRLNEIRKLTKPEQWYYVPTESNPSDLPSRGCLLSDLINNPIWLKGPEFIQQLTIPIFKVVQPNFNDPEIRTILLSQEVEHSNTNNTHDLTFNKSMMVSCKNLSEVIDLSRYSYFAKLLRVTSYMFRFIARTRNKKYATSNDLSAEEIDVSRLDWVSHVQQRYARDNKEAFIKAANNL